MYVHFVNETGETGSAIKVFDFCPLRRYFSKNGLKSVWIEYLCCDGTDKGIGTNSPIGAVDVQRVSLSVPDFGRIQTDILTIIAAVVIFISHLGIEIPIADYTTQEIIRIGAGFARIEGMVSVIRVVHRFNHDIPGLAQFHPGNPVTRIGKFKVTVISCRSIDPYQASEICLPSRVARHGRGRQAIGILKCDPIARHVLEPFKPTIPILLIDGRAEPAGDAVGKDNFHGAALHVAPGQNGPFRAQGVNIRAGHIFRRAPVQVIAVHIRLGAGEAFEIAIGIGITNVAILTGDPHMDIEIVAPAAADIVFIGPVFNALIVPVTTPGIIVDACKRQVHRAAGGNGNVGLGNGDGTVVGAHADRHGAAAERDIRLDGRVTGVAHGARRIHVGHLMDVAGWVGAFGIGRGGGIAPGAAARSGLTIVQAIGDVVLINAMHIGFVQIGVKAVRSSAHRVKNRRIHRLVFIRRRQTKGIARKLFVKHVQRRGTRAEEVFRRHTRGRHRGYEHEMVAVEMRHGRHRHLGHAGRLDRIKRDAYGFSRFQQSRQGYTRAVQAGLFRQHRDIGGLSLRFQKQRQRIGAAP
ncbi:MAG: hypothetical protein BWX80_02907 [Candidatus Hydrogenedentes bacterium ADurb.Bin101]|nr:MAG: hypothetical protein BWX80_02907 [Candidatus Hydrogenedentes bacterium ADurb.Bin101]